MLIILLLYCLLGFWVLWSPGALKKYSALLIALLQLGSFAYFLSHVPYVREGFIKSQFISWIPQLGLDFHVQIDGLSLLYALLVTFIGALVFLYAKAYMKKYANKSRFYFFLTWFSGAMLGLVLSVNLIQLFVFWELTSLFSFLLISFFNEKESSRKAAFQSLFVTGFGGLCLLVGIVLIGSHVGSYSLSDWISASNEIKASSIYTPSLILIFLGVFTKSAQFPFHFWLPWAMQAPTPVSAYLHSATMVKAGVFLLMRLNPVLGGTELWMGILPVVGSITMLVGAYMSITQTDIKAIFAYTTISSLGVLVFLMGIDTKVAVKAALVFLVVHAFYKAALFMLAGYIDKQCGTRDITRLGGLIKQLPLTFIVSALALFSMAGLPPMIGFIGKELIYEASVQATDLGFFILIIV